ncbi:thermonuclease family protein [Simplicispira psychrophila]|uniref:thermonuclease family protein n=1 Tax=Simplicispira psychrophila TaxID=80882 RepID=UPI00048429B1|nr:thermonuclease family protein [Simplicispira psychrophila]
MPVSIAALFCLVVAISDGDTLTARCGLPAAAYQIKVRIAAIDAPESRQAYGTQARKNLLQLCLRQRARIEPLDQDAYGRSVANVRCGSTDVASAQVRAGLAWVYTPYARQHPYLAPLQRQAKARGMGLWAQRRPVAPWTYRHRYLRRVAV